MITDNLLGPAVHCIQNLHFKTFNVLCVGGGGSTVGSRESFLVQKCMGMGQGSILAQTSTH